MKFLAACFPLAVAGASLWLAGSADMASSLLRPQEPNFTLEGKIIRLEPGKFTVSTEENIVFHVRYTDKTEVKRADGSSGTPKDLRMNALVHVEGDLSESGEILAAKIQILSPPSSKPR